MSIKRKRKTIVAKYLERLPEYNFMATMRRTRYNNCCSGVRHENVLVVAVSMKKKKRKKAIFGRFTNGRCPSCPPVISRRCCENSPASRTLSNGIHRVPRRSSRYSTRPNNGDRLKPTENLSGC